MTAPQDVHNMMQAYFAGDCSPETFEAIEAWLKEDPANLRRFAEYGYIEDILFAEQDSIDSTSIHTLLAEETAVPDFLSAPAFPTNPQEKQNGNTITARQFASLSGYLLGEALTSRMAYKAYAYAAVALLAVTLFFVFSGDDAETDQIADQSQNTTPLVDRPVELEPAAVATLTAEYNAVWKQPGGDHRPGRLRQGTQLSAGQRLALTQGSATLTTAKGAVATIYAPCSIELIDDNALHLTRGRLSGRVDTDRAEGFAVHLPSGDRIVDLGTAFTVAVDDAGRPDVRVTEGLVAWVPKPSAADRTPAKPLLIAANQSAALVAGRPVLTRAERLLGIDFQHTGAPSPGGNQPMVGVTQPGFVTFDETHFADGNRATFATDAGEITLALAGLDIDQHDGYFTRLPTPAEDPFPGFDLYNDFVFENDDGRFTLTLAGPAITPGQAYDLTFYAYDPAADEPGNHHGRAQSVAFTGIEGTAGQAGPITYTVGTHPTHAEQYKTTAAFTADAQGRITIEATDAYEDDFQRIRLCAIEIARRVAPDTDTTN